jgi:hypothetical protein
MKLVGIKVILFCCLLLSGSQSFAYLRRPELSMELTLKKPFYQNGDMMQFEVRFTNQTDRDLSILLPGNQTKGKRILQLQVFSVNQDTHYYTKVFENPLELEMDTSIQGSVQFKRLRAKESVSIPLFVNDRVNARKNIYSNYAFPDFNQGTYQVLAYYNPFGETLAPYAFQAYDFEGNNIEDTLNPERLQMDASGIYSNYVSLTIYRLNSDAFMEIEHDTCSDNCRFCRHIEKEQWNRVRKDIIHRVDNIAEHQHVRFLFHGPDAVLSSLPAYFSRQIVFDTENGLEYKYLTWQIGKIHRFRSFIHKWCYWIFHWNAPLHLSDTKYFRLISIQ